MISHVFYFSLESSYDAPEDIVNQTHITKIVFVFYFEVKCTFHPLKNFKNIARHNINLNNIKIDNYTIPLSLIEISKISQKNIRHQL